MFHHQVHFQLKFTAKEALGSEAGPRWQVRQGASDAGAPAGRVLAAAVTGSIGISNLPVSLVHSLRLRTRRSASRRAKGGTCR